MQKILLSIRALVLIGSILFSCFSYSNLDCYAQFFDQKKSILKLPEDPAERELLWRQVKSNPDRFANMLDIPKNTKIRNQFFEFAEQQIKLPYVTEVFPIFHPQTNNGINQRIIKQLGITLSPQTTADQSKQLTENQMIEIAEKIENKIFSLLNQIEKIKQTIKQPDNTLKKIAGNLRQIHEKIKKLSSYSPRIWENHNSQVENIEKELNIISRQKQIKTFEDLLKQPSFLLADHNYSINFQNGEAYYIQFNKKVIKSLKKLATNQIRLILEKVTKGFVSEKQETGLKMLIQSSTKNKYKNHLVEIKTIGSATGHIRIGGFINGNLIKFVHFISTNNHSKRNTKQNFKENIYQRSLNSEDMY